MHRPSTLTIQNALALLGLPLYLCIRPVLRLLGVLGRRATGSWIIGGHSGRIFADNAAALHSHAHAAGRDVTFVVSDPALLRELASRGFKTVRRNSWAARIAIENASLLAYSHGITDLDHVLPRVVTLRALKVHLNHCMNFLKAGQLAAPEYARLSEREKRARAAALDPFDYLLAISERERANFGRSFPGREAQIVLGGGAHLDAFMTARARPSGRNVLYFPTFRETPQARARLTTVIANLASDARLHAFLEREDRYLDVVTHLNSAAYKTTAPVHARVRFIPPAGLLDSLLASAAFVSDYSGLLCDQLALDRPTIFFPFDKDDYLTGRNLYEDYAEFAWGPVVMDVASLVDLLCTGRYADTAPYAARRAYWETAFFPRFTPDYAEHCLHTIDALAERHGAAR